jgi:DHA1 family tetracycline resistance protein-like MFS transporter
MRGWRPVLLLTVFLQLLGFGLVLPLLPYYGRALGAGAAEIGLLFGAYSLTQFLLAPLWGALADRYGRRPVLLASIAGGVAAYVVFAVAGSYPVLLLSRVLAGLSAAVIGVGQAYLADRTPPEDRARGMGLLGAALGMGFVVGPALGAVLSRWGYAVPGFVAAGLTAANFVLALRGLPESLPPERRREALGGVHPLRRLRAGTTPGLAGVLAILFLTTAAFSVLYPVFPLFLHARFGYGPMEAGVLFSLVGLVAAAVQGGALGKLARAAGERPLLRAGALVMGAGLALLPLQFVRTPAVLVATLLPMALGFAVTTPIAQTLLSRLSTAAEQASSLGMGQSMTSLARACGPLLGGFLYEHAGTASPFWTAALLLAAAALLVGTVPDAEAHEAATAGASYAGSSAVEPLGPTAGPSRSRGPATEPASTGSGG